jgi:hypothetical protein
MIETMRREGNERQVHVRFSGRSFDVALSELRLNGGGAEVGLRRALAEYMDLSVEALRDYVVEEHENGNWTLRPQAVFG